MKLIALILALAGGRILGDGDRILDFRWFHDLHDWLEKHLSAYRIWDSPAGILVTVAIPLIVLALVLAVLHEVLAILPFILSLAVLYFCLGYEALDRSIEIYNSALVDGSDGYIADAVGTILENDPVNSGNDGDRTVLGSLLQQGNDRVFAVIFWFLVLGPLGALLYRLVYEVLQKRFDIHGPYSDSARDLYLILNWPCIRLTLLSYAMVGNLIHALDAWRDHDDLSLLANEKLLAEGGLAAISCGPDDPADRESQQYYLEHTDGLLKRSIILWLTVIAVSTISGWLA